MLLISQVKMKPGYSMMELEAKIASMLKVLPEDIKSVSLEKESIDARKKPDVFMVLNCLCEVAHEDSVLKRLRSDQVRKYEPVEYEYEVTGNEKLNEHPVIVGAGPAGLFAAFFLAMEGYKPLLIERGFDVDSRLKDVEEFWETGNLRPGSNVLFGEGGAGTFSDGKLNTLVKDKFGRNRKVLEIFVKAGADPKILYENKPHIGTDVLVNVVKNIRENIISMGGEVRFNAELTGIHEENGVLKYIEINGIQKVPCEVLILAIGHSARDTFKMLKDSNVHMESKDFAVGLRVEHLQDKINKALYSNDPEILKKLPPASYKLAAKTEEGRGVYSFCMCPGGFVVNASSEKGHLCINGMSYSKRNGKNANSAIVVTVGKEDFGSDDALAGIEFQRKLEKKAFEIGNGFIPVEHYGNFKAEVKKDVNLSDSDVDNLFSFSPETKGKYTFAKVSEILPSSINKAIIEGMEHFDKIIPGFADDYTLVCGVETRTSSPVRITRDEDFVSLNVKGLYPCGEGAGYAGGITSAAMDGMKVFEKIIAKYKPISE